MAPKRSPARLVTTLAAGQGLYYLLTGLWRLVHLATFEAVTGPKTDAWLVQTVGVLVTAIGATLCSAAASRIIADEIALLAMASAAGLAAIDVMHVISGTIGHVYLLDAAVEVAFVAAWAFAKIRSARAHRPTVIYPFPLSGRSLRSRA
jgi:hypothetical protein